MKHLITISIGPVQDFIAAARRMGDLWYGSRLLGEISAAVAESVSKSGGSLIFPHPDMLNDAGPGAANIVLAELPEGADPAKVAEDARKAAAGYFRCKADEAFEKLGKDVLREETWNNQRDDVVEVFSAWAPLDGDYPAARRTVMRLLAARKATREFLPAKGQAGVPKSTLDGLRETVLQKKGKDKDGPIYTSDPRLRLNGKELLDCIGVVKRFQSQGKTFPSIATVTASEWLRRVPEAAGADPQIAGDYKALVNLHKKLFDLKAIRSAMGGWEYEASPLYENRKEQVVADAGDKKDEARKACDEIAKIVKRLSGKKEIGRLERYYAMLLADGDHMGKALDGIDSADGHRAFSRLLAGFARSVPEKLAEAGCVCIYSGGDDILAVAPLRKALQAARICRDSFHKAMSQVQGVNNPPTLSVGIAICHVQEPLDFVRKFAATAEHRAKNPVAYRTEGKDRNGLAVALHTRGSDTETVRGNWSDNFDAVLAGWVKLFIEGKLPGNIPYATVRELDDIRDWQDAARIKDALPKLLCRLWEHKQLNLDELGVRERLMKTDSPQALDQLVAELRIARFIATGVDE